MVYGAMSLTSSSLAAVAAALTPLCACTLNGCRAKLCQNPPTSRLAPTPRPAVASALAPTYQPASRYWAFQGIETGIFVVLAAALLAVALAVVSRRDA